MRKHDFVVCARNTRGKGKKQKFGAENAPCSYLLVPDGELPGPAHCVDARAWVKALIADARRDVRVGEFGNILLFVHGYNNSQGSVIRQHRRLRDDLRAARLRCTVVSFDWPSGDVGAFYLEDLKDAHDSAHQLLEEGIVLLAGLQQPGCTINVHILAHSMGAYVTRQAFAWADDIDELTGRSWHVSQIMLIAADISTHSMEAGDHRSSTMFRVSNRITSYSNRHDGVLGLSNVKRAGVAARVGRVGLPDDALERAINVDCSDYWTTIPREQTVLGHREHSWHIGDPTFTRDMIDTMRGVDREAMTTRQMQEHNRFVLVRA